VPPDPTPPPPPTSQEGIENDAGDGSTSERRSLPSERDLGTRTLFPEVQKLFGHDNDLLALASSGGLVASACKARDVEEAAIRLWDVGGEGAERGALKGGHKSSVACLAFSSSGDGLLASSGKDRRLCVWKIADDHNQHLLLAAVDNAHKRIVWDISWCSAEGKERVLATGGRDGGVKVWEVLEAEIVLKAEMAFKGESVTAVSFAPGREDILAVGFEHGDVKIVRVGGGAGGGEILGAIGGGHLAAVRRLAWRPAQGQEDELVLASCGDDNVVNISKLSLL
jgi:elongator complex protein 2